MLRERVVAKVETVEAPHIARLRVIVEAWAVREYDRRQAATQERGGNEG